jgi:hypothetical protein
MPGTSFALPHAPSDIIEDLSQITGTVPAQSPKAHVQFNSFLGSGFGADSVADTGGILFPGVRGEIKNLIGCYSEIDTLSSCGDSIFLGSF